MCVHLLYVFRSISMCSFRSVVANSWRLFVVGGICPCLPGSVFLCCFTGSFSLSLSLSLTLYPSRLPLIVISEMLMFELIAIPDCFGPVSLTQAPKLTPKLLAATAPARGLLQTRRTLPQKSYISHPKPLAPEPGHALACAAWRTRTSCCRSQPQTLNPHQGGFVTRPWCFFSRKLQRRVLRQIASPIQHSITQHNITPQQDTPQQDPPQHHTPQQDIHRSKTPHLQTGLYCILIIFLIIS